MSTEPVSRRQALRALAGIGLSSSILPQRDLPPTLPLGVFDEHGPLRIALLHRPLNATDTRLEQLHLHIPEDERNDHPESGEVRRDVLLQQHENLVQLLEHFKVQIVEPLPLDGNAGQVFTRDPCFVVNSTLYLAALRDPSRRPERRGLAKLTRAVPSVVDLAGHGAHIEGGDVFVLEQGRKILVGTNRHTNQAGIRHLRRHLRGSGTEVIVIPHRALHLDCCLAPLPSGDALYCPAKLPEGSLATLRCHFRHLHLVPRQESEQHLAPNLLWIDPLHVIANRQTPRTLALLQHLGYEVLDLEFSDPVRLWGSFRCVVCPLLRDPALPDHPTAVPSPSDP